MPQKNRVLITGSCGMLGSDLIDELAENYEITCADLVTRSPDHQITRFYKVDITDKREIAEIIVRVKPQIVVHTAAMTDVDGCERDKDKAYRINSEGTKNVALACKAADAVLICISTDFVFDGKKRTSYTEIDRPSPLSIYGLSKLKGEEVVQEVLDKYFILRTSWLYGRCGKNFVDTIIAKGKTEKVLKVVNDQVGSPTYTVDLSKAVHVLIDLVASRQPPVASKKYGIYHVSNSGSTSWYGYAKEILRMSGSKTEVVPISSEELGRPAKRPAMSVMDNSRFMELTGYKFRDWKEALKDYINSKTRSKAC